MPSLLLALIPLVLVAVTVTVGILRARWKRQQKPRQAREASAFVILEGNVWEASSVNDLREPWSKYTTEPVRGFCGVPVGRHRVRTSTPSGEATLDFVAYPGEVLSWRLDSERARWEPCDLDADTRSVLEAVPVSSADVNVGFRPKTPGWLVHLRTTMSIGKRSAGITLGRSSEEGIERLRKRVSKLVGMAESDNDSDVDVLAEAKAIGEAIVGRQLSRRDMRSLVASVRDSATRLTARNDSDRAMRVLALGLAVLPGDPELMVTAGTALAARGEADEALRVLNAALERDRCLEAEDVAKAMRARMELRTRLGRSVRV